MIRLNILVVKKPKNNGDMKPGNNKLANIDKKQIDELLKSALQEYLVHQSSAKKEKSQNMHNLATLVSEYLSAFIIIGYDMNGAPTNYIHAKSQMDADALSAAVNRFIFNAANNSDEKQ